MFMFSEIFLVLEVDRLIVGGITCCLAKECQRSRCPVCWLRASVQSQGASVYSATNERFVVYYEASILFKDIHVMCNGNICCMLLKVIG